MLSLRTSARGSDRLGARWLGVIAATFVLVGQFATAAHIHAGRLRPDAASQAQVSTNAGVCAVCELAHHATPAPVVAPSLLVPCAESATLLVVAARVTGRRNV